MKLDAIREKLEIIPPPQAFPAPPRTGQLPWDSPPATTPVAASTAAQSTQGYTPADYATLEKLHNTLTVLRQRSVALGVPPILETSSPEVPFSPSGEAISKVAPSEAARSRTASSETAKMVSAYDRLIELSWQRLSTQAERINQLAAAQATALTEFKTIADRLERDVRRRALALDPAAVPEPIGIWRYQASVPVPRISQDDQGCYQLVPQAVDLLQAEREAAATAQQLRAEATKVPGHSQNFFPNPPPADDPMAHAPTAPAANPAPHSPRFERWLNHHLTALGAGLSWRLGRRRLSLVDGLIWFSTAALGRVGLGLLAPHLPGLELGTMVMLAVFGAIALYQALFAPRPDLGLGYRLLILLAGLIVGGRL